MPPSFSLLRAPCLRWVISFRVAFPSLYPLFTTTVSVCPLSIQHAAHTVFVLNLSWFTTKEELADAFAPAGKVKEARVVTGKDGKAKGFGFVEYEDAVCSCVSFKCRYNGFKAHIHLLTCALSYPLAFHSASADLYASLFRSVCQPSAARAVQQLNGIVIRGREVKVSLSNSEMAKSQQPAPKRRRVVKVENLPTTENLEQLIKEHFKEVSPASSLCGVWFA